MACAVGGKCSSGDDGALVITLSLSLMWRLGIGMGWCDDVGDMNAPPALCGSKLRWEWGVDATREYPMSQEHGDAEDDNGMSESPGVGERDRDLGMWLDILRRVLGSKPVKREPPSGVSQPR